MQKLSRLILSAALLSISGNSLALETDNYLVWGVELKDSSSEINDFVAKQIESSLAISNAFKNPQSCESVTFEIAQRFKTTPSTKSLETFVNESLDKEMIYPKDPYYLEESILRNTLRFYLEHSGLSPNIQMNGIYFGADKLSHFASTGRRYLKHYLKKVRRGYSEEEAQRSMIRFGLLNEQTVLGIWASGVFSYGDMEANYQGFLFYKKLCIDNESYLEQETNGKWKLKNKPDLNLYVNAHWDEAFNLSYFAKGTWKQTSLIIKNDYCEMRKNPLVQARKEFYLKRNDKSFSLIYIDELKNKSDKLTPNPEKNQSLEELCQESNLASN